MYGKVRSRKKSSFDDQHTKLLSHTGSRQSTADEVRRRSPRQRQTAKECCPSNCRNASLELGSSSLGKQSPLSEASPTPDDQKDLMDMLTDPSEIWLHGVTLIADSPLSANSCSLCAADPDTEMLGCRCCGDQYHLYCVDEANMPCSEEAQLAWRCRRCRSEPSNCLLTDHQKAEDWQYIPSPAPVTSLSPAALEHLQPLSCSWCPPVTSLSPAALEHLEPVSCSWCPPVTPLTPAALENLQSLSCSWCPNLSQKELTALGGDRSDLLSAPASPALTFTLEELVAGGGPLRTVPQPNGTLAAAQMGDEQMGDNTEVMSNPTPHSTDSQSEEEEEEEEEEFRGFIKSEIQQLVLDGEMYSQHGRNCRCYGSEAAQYPKRRGRRGRKYPASNKSYNLRQSCGKSRKSYRQTRTRQKKGEWAASNKDGVTGQSDAASPVAGEEDAAPVVYTVSLQYQLVDGAAALEMLRGPPSPELTGDALEAVSLGYLAASDWGASGDLLERLRQTMQDELDRLGYPAPSPSAWPGPHGRPSNRRRTPVLKRMPDCMLEEEWQAWRRLMPPRRGRPRKYPRPDDLSWILQMKQLGVNIGPDSCMKNEASVTRLEQYWARATKPRRQRAAAALDARPAVSWSGELYAAGRHRWTAFLPSGPRGRLLGRQGRRRLSAALRRARRRSCGRVPRHNTPDGHHSGPDGPPSEER